MRKIFAIAWKDIYQIFTDSSLLLIMIVTPLVISTIVALVFGGSGNGGGTSLSNIPVAIVNRDAGATDQNGEVNYGDQFVAMLIPPENADSSGFIACPLAESTEVSGGISLDELISAELLDSAAAARAGVDNGDYAAAVIIPSNFSQSFLVDPMSDSVGEPIQVEVYGSEGAPISASVMRSVTDAIINTNTTGTIAIDTALTTLIQNNPAAMSQIQGNEDVQALFSCGFSSVLGTVTVNTQPVTPGDTRNLFEVILLSVGASQAVFFALFSAQFGVLSIIEERRAGTLQRLFVSPTSRLEILTGKLIGTYGTVIFQLVAMLLALTLVSSILSGSLTNIWGTNFIGIVAVVLAVSLAACGIGMLLAGFTSTPEQAGPVGGVVNLILAMFGGAFGVTFGPPLSYISLIYWGTDAFNKLSAGDSDILLNLIILVGQGLVFFAIGLVMFSRRGEE